MIRHDTQMSLEEELRVLEDEKRSREEDEERLRFLQNIEKKDVHSSSDRQGWVALALFFLMIVAACSQS